MRRWSNGYLATLSRWRLRVRNPYAVRRLDPEAGIQKPLALAAGISQDAIESDQGRVASVCKSTARRVTVKWMRCNGLHACLPNRRLSGSSPGIRTCFRYQTKSMRLTLTPA